MTYPGTARSCDTLGPQTKLHAFTEIQIQKKQASAVPHTHSKRRKIGIGLKLTDDVTQTRHILRLHRIAGRILSGAVYLDFGLHVFQPFPASCKPFLSSRYMLAPNLLVSRFTTALLSDRLFRRCITTAHACPYRKAEGCCDEKSGDGGHRLKLKW